MTRDAASFERLYRAQADPWDYETSAYEADKYRRCLGLLPHESYGRGLEVGCSIGVMSALIARRCDTLLGLDLAPTAIARAQGRGIQNATFKVGAVPQDWPGGQWNLIVLSEVLYYLTPPALEATIDLAACSLAPRGTCLVAGYLGPTETELTAPEVETRLLDRLRDRWPDHALARDGAPSWTATSFTRAQGPSPGR